MTFSICVREAYGDGARFGVAVTTRLPAVGALCPFASERGAVATQSHVDVSLGERGIDYIDDGLAAGDALSALLAADDGSADRQLHGVSAADEFAFTGDGCDSWCGDRVGDNYTVAGNLLTGHEVVDAVAETYEAGESHAADPEPSLAERLIDALGAGQDAGGDKREELTVQSAALLVRDTADHDGKERGVPDYGTDLRVDASEQPVADLRAAYEAATDGFAAAAERYEAAVEAGEYD